MKPTPSTARPQRGLPKTPVRGEYVQPDRMPKGNGPKPKSPFCGSPPGMKRGGGY